MERRNPSSIMTSTFKSISILIKSIYDETYNFECLPINNSFCDVHYLDHLFFFLYRSDVLGQFMPLVGRDWTQSGVARFFSAIKVCLCLTFNFPKSLFDLCRLPSLLILPKFVGANKAIRYF
jgi:hypothetical protein